MIVVIVKSIGISSFLLFSPYRLSNQKFEDVTEVLACIKAMA